MAGPAVGTGDEENGDASGRWIPADLIGQREPTAVGKGRVQDNGVGRPHGQCPPGPGQLGFGRDQVVRFPECLVNATSQNGIALDYQDVGRHGQGLYTAIPND